jgi:hypothetical protein
MKNLAILGIVLLTLELGAAVALAQGTTRHDIHTFHAPAKTKPESDTNRPASAALPAFEKIKTLVGDWEARDGTAYGGKPIRVSYKVVSGGTSLMETYYQVGPDYIDMVTIYHLDGDNLVATHFCDVNNQVRLRADRMSDDRALTFNYVDATNLSLSNEEVINKVEIAFVDKDHFTQTWVWRMTNSKGETRNDKAIYKFVRRK